VCFGTPAASSSGRELANASRRIRTFRFFESSIPLLEETLPASADVCETFAAAGLDLVAVADDHADYRLGLDGLLEKLAAGGDSVLARLSREDFDAGLAR
jgi:hypothetical protein